jgi:Na+/H+ antiporter NhaC
MVEWLIAHMFETIFAGWGVGFISYMFLSKLNKINNKHYYDVKNNIRKFKKIRDEVNGVERKLFK